MSPCRRWVRPQDNTSRRAEVLRRDSIDLTRAMSALLAEVVVPTVVRGRP